MIPFVHLHVHSYYSILDGQASISRLVDKAIADGMRGMALTDHGNMMGVKDFFNYVQKKKGGASKDFKKAEAQLKELQAKAQEAATLHHPMQRVALRFWIFTSTSTLCLPSARSRPEARCPRRNTAYRKDYSCSHVNRRSEVYS